MFTTPQKLWLRGMTYHGLYTVAISHPDAFNALCMLQCDLWVFLMPYRCTIWRKSCPICKKMLIKSTHRLIHLLIRVSSDSLSVSPQLTTERKCDFMLLTAVFDKYSKLFSFFPLRLLLFSTQSILLTAAHLWVFFFPYPASVRISYTLCLCVLWLFIPMWWWKKMFV